MFELSCKICGETFEAKTMFTKYCSAKCRMIKYRSTVKGKQQYQRYNQRYKRPEIELSCQICNRKFKSTRKNTSTCNGLKCRSQAAYLAQKKQRLKHPDKHKANDTVNKRIKRQVSLFRLPCVICNSPNAEAHHRDYDKPLDITWLCKEHHTLEHRAINMMNISMSYTIQTAMNDNKLVSLCI